MEYEERNKNLNRLLDTWNRLNHYSPYPKNNSDEGKLEKTVSNSPIESQNADSEEYSID